MRTLYLLIFSLLFISVLVTKSRAQCKVKFTFQSSPANDSFTVQFYDLSENINFWFWDFDDGSTSSSKKQNPKYTFSNIGNHQVTLLGSDTISGCFKQYKKVITIPGIYKACNALFYYDSLDVNRFQFYDTSFYASPGTAQKRRTWSFGDGQTSNLANPLHTYSVGGKYEVCLVTYDSLTSCSDSICKTIYSLVCEADFSTIIDSNGDGVNFVGTYSQGYNPHTFEWDFGDGDTSTLAEPYHQYKKTGSYKVCLYVNNNNICHDTVCKTISINYINKCLNGFTFTGDKKKISFHPDTLLDSNYHFYWDFGDQQSDSTKAPIHSYLHAGTYFICMTASRKDYNCSKTICQSLKIDPEKIYIDKSPFNRSSSIRFNYEKKTAVLKFQPRENEKFDLLIYDDIMKLLTGFYSIGNTDFSFSLPPLAPGIYFYILNTPEGTISKGHFFYF